MLLVHPCLNPLFNLFPSIFILNNDFNVLIDGYTFGGDDGLTRDKVGLQIMVLSVLDKLSNAQNIEFAIVELTKCNKVGIFENRFFIE